MKLEMTWYVFLYVRYAGCDPTDPGVHQSQRAARPVLKSMDFVLNAERSKPIRSLLCLISYIYPTSTFNVDSKPPNWYVPLGWDPHQTITL